LPKKRQTTALSAISFYNQLIASINQSVEPSTISFVNTAFNWYKKDAATIANAGLKRGILKSPIITNFSQQ
jgi:hypothetical protein